MTLDADDRIVYLLYQSDNLKLLFSFKILIFDEFRQFYFKSFWKLQFKNKVINATKTNYCLKCTKFRMRPKNFECNQFVNEKNIYMESKYMESKLWTKAKCTSDYSSSMCKFQMFHTEFHFDRILYGKNTHCTMDKFMSVKSILPAYLCCVVASCVIIYRFFGHYHLSGGKIQHLWIVEMKYFKNNTQQQLIHIKHSTHYKGLRFFSC